MLDQGVREVRRGINQSELGAGQAKHASYIQELTQYFLPKNLGRRWEGGHPVSGYLSFPISL